MRDYLGKGSYATTGRLIKKESGDVFSCFSIKRVRGSRVEGDSVD